MTSDEGLTVATAASLERTSTVSVLLLK